MKKYLAILTLSFLAAGVMTVSAQDQEQAPPPPDSTYGQWDQSQPPQQSPVPPDSQYSGPQDPGQSGDEQSADQGPAPGVARLSVIQGNVSTQRGDNSEWVAATVNTPVAVGDRVSTGPDGRAEIQIDSANVIRLSGNTTVKIANITRENIQVQVGQGLVTYAVVRPAEANAEIDTPNAALHPDGPGDYRIQVNSDGETEAIIRSGSADVTEPQGSTHVNAGQLITIQGTDNPQYKTENAPTQDAWDSWNSDRDHRITSARSWKQTDPYYTGSEDLDNYGEWSEVPDYGPVWIPQQGPDWAPYSDGRWVWEPYYGWTWVSYEPWGWAPYHYGRWFVYGGNWAWWPGPVVGYPGYYPIWSPAYVSFFGWGGGGFGFGVGFGFGWGFGHVGWLPCGPGDWYHPWYGRWGGRFNTVSVRGDRFRDGFRPIGPGGRGFSNVNEAFHNARVRGGMVSMDSNRFGREAVHGAGARMSEASFRGASMVNGRMPISPSRGSYSASNHAANPSSFRNAPSSSQHFFSAAGRNSNGFAGRNNNVSARESFGANANRNGGASANRGGSFNGNAGGNRSAITSNRPGWHTFTPPSSANRGGEANGNFSNRGNAGGQSANREGYQRFSQPSQQSGRGYSGSERSYNYNSPGSASREGSSNSYSHSYSYSRPQLNMRQPIVTPRGGSYGGEYGRGSYGGYSQPRGNYSEPRGNYSAPRGYSEPRGGGYSAPHGNYSEPRGGGGGGSHGGGGGGGGSSHGGGGGGSSHGGGGGHGHR